MVAYWIYLLQYQQPPNLTSVSDYRLAHSDLKEKKLLDEKENGKDATNGKENDENGEPEIDDEEDDEVDEEEEEEGEGDEEDEDEDDDELGGGTKRSAEDDDEDEEDDVDPKKQKKDD